MKRILLIVAIIGASTLTHAQSKDSVNLQLKNEKTEMKQADQQRLQMEKEQLQAKPEILYSEKMSGKQKTKKICCNGKSCKKG